MKKSKSFTLIELLVVVAIIGIIATIAVVATRGVIGRARIARTLQSEASMHRYLGMDIVGWWKFDGDLTDISGQGNDGTWGGVGDPQYVDGVPGKGGNALNFDGTDDYVYTSTFPKLSEFTISFWLKGGVPYRYGGFVAGMSSGLSTLRWGVHVSDWYMSLRISDDEFLEDWNIEPYDYPEGWHHIVTTFSGTTGSFHRNGQYISSYDFEITNTGTNVPIWMGRGVTSIHSYLEGILDDVRIYSYVLTSEEINTLYAETKHKYIAENNNKEK